ncbi:MAG: FHA domain-containing protein [Ignavibacteria bacterium]|nr:FHA domain-containing protein [Ignavibacteria bacterium]
MASPTSKLAILFADISRSTYLFELYGDVTARQIVAETLTILAEITRKYNGFIIKTIGDEIFCTFVRPDQAFKAACEMNRSLHRGVPGSQVKISIKISLHYGPVLIENNDVYGDAVNLGSRIMEVCKPEQILISTSTLDYLPEPYPSPVRNIGKIQFRGKLESVDISEIIWQEDTSALTKHPTIIKERKKELNILYLELTCRNKKVILTNENQIFHMGRSENNDLIIDKDLVSRRHAYIEYRNGKFTLADRSTNGTYVKYDAGESILVQREEIVLFGDGIIRLGDEKDEKDQIRFSCKI